MKKGNRVTHRLLILGMMGPALLVLPIVLEGQQKGYPWWYYLLTIVGAGYLIPVFGTLAGWKLLVAISQKVGFTINFVLRALIGMLLFATGSVVLLSDSLEEVGETARRFFSPPDGLLLLLVIGLSYAGLPVIVHQLQQRKRK